MARLSVTGEVHHCLRRRIGHGDAVIDATVGNGHDALFMASRIGESGHLYGFDIQPEALAVTAERLASSSLAHRATLFLHSHEEMCSKIPLPLHGRIRCIMFNLGYLPGGDKSLVTDAVSTLKALKESVDLLMPGGVISLLAYRGHPGGDQECRAVMKWAERLPAALYEVSLHDLLPDHRLPPLWLLIEKRGDA